MGPSRHVIHALGYKRIGKRWFHLYQLECGHIVQRSVGGKSLCYCEKCQANAAANITSGKRRPPA